MNWYLDVLKKYAVFSGRARRKEFWIFYLFNCMIFLVVPFIGGIIGGTSAIVNMYCLVVLIPSIAVGVRRMHDTDKSGWWLLIPIVNLIFLAQDSQRGDNQFGPNPKGEPASPRPVVQPPIQQPIRPPVQRPINQPIVESPTPGTKITVPAITQEYLSINLVDSSTLGDAGPGGSSFQDAIQNMNNKNDSAATNCFEEALRKGLDPLRQGYAHSNLGEIYVRANEIEKALNEFVKVLNFKEALYESVHTAAQYLVIIYSEIGKPEAAKILAQLTFKTSVKINYSLSPATTDRVRQLAIKNKNRFIERNVISSSEPTSEEGISVSKRFHDEIQNNAINGDVKAQIALGLMYDSGEGIPKDKKKAVEWYSKAALQGNAEAQFYLGELYRDGDSVTKDLKKAFEYSTMAAEQGFAKAQYNLGVMYFNGDGVTKDKRKAVEWLTKGAEQGFALAQLKLGLMCFHGDGVTQDKKIAVEWITKSADQGNADAQFNLGAMFYNGDGVVLNKTKALNLWVKAANQGHKAARDILNKLRV